MKGRITALVATTAAAVSAAGAALWARRRRGTEEEPRAHPAGGQKTPAAAEPEAGEMTTTEPAAATVDAPGMAAGGAASEGPDDLTVIRGIGAARAERLHELGVTRLAQIAAWSDRDIEDIAPQLRLSPERIRQDDWVGQARAATEG